jgi:hypothetical protein
VDLATFDGQVHTLDDLGVSSGGVQVFDYE